MYSRPSEYRNRFPIDNRYDYYSWPEIVVAKCPKCREKVNFKATSQKIGAMVQKIPIPDGISGRGSCIACSFVFEKILWPDDAHFQIELKQGVVWAWNETFLEILKNKAESRPIPDRSFDQMHPLALYFLARLPKFALTKASRVRMIKKIEVFENNA